MNSLLDYMAWSVLAISILISLLFIVIGIRGRSFLEYYGIWIIQGTFFELLSTSLATFGKHNLWAFHLNALVEFTVLILYFHILFKELHRPGIKFFIIPGLLLILTNSVFLQGLDKFNSHSLTAVSLGTVFISIFYFIRLFDSEMDLENKFFRVILTGSILIMHSTNLFPLLFGNALINLDYMAQDIIWVIRASVILVVKIIIFYTLIGHITHWGHQKMQA